MPVLSVDLAYRRWSDLGVVVLSRSKPRAGPVLVGQVQNSTARGAIDRDLIDCEIIPANAAGFAASSEASSVTGLDLELAPGPVDANILAGRLNHLANTREIRVIVLDGPQAWKSLNNGAGHARISESQLNTAAKTGLPGMVKPITYRLFTEFCLDVYDALCRRGWRRLDTRDQPASRGPQTQGRVLVESYPHAAWKSLGLKPLPSKRRARVSDLAEAYGALQRSDSHSHQPPAKSRSASGHRRRLAGAGDRRAQLSRLRASSAIRPAARTATGARASSSCRCRQSGPSRCAGCTESCSVTCESRARAVLAGRRRPGGRLFNVRCETGVYLRRRRGRGAGSLRRRRPAWAWALPASWPGPESRAEWCLPCAA